MAWQFRQKTGELTCNGSYIGVGYSGTGEGRNNPDMESVPNVGVIPKGTYKIGDAYDDPHLGHCVMHLDPTPDTNTYGRSLFRIHGNNAQNDASHGCVILPPIIRNEIADSDDDTLIVV